MLGTRLESVHVACTLKEFFFCVRDVLNMLNSHRAVAGGFAQRRNAPIQMSRRCVADLPLSGSFFSAL